MHRQKVADCLRRAEEAREIAKGIFDDSERAAFLRIVDDFERLMLESIERKSAAA